MEAFLQPVGVVFRGTLGIVRGEMTGGNDDRDATDIHALSIEIFKKY